MRPEPVIQETIWSGMHTRSFSSRPQIYPPNYFWHRLILKSICIPPDSCCWRFGGPETSWQATLRPEYLSQISLCGQWQGITSMLGRVSKLQHRSPSLCSVFYCVCLKIGRLPGWRDVCHTLDAIAALSLLRLRLYCRGHNPVSNLSLLSKLAPN